MTLSSQPGARLSTALKPLVGARAQAPDQLQNACVVPCVRPPVWAAARRGCGSSVPACACVCERQRGVGGSWWVPGCGVLGFGGVGGSVANQLAYSEVCAFGGDLGVCLVRLA